MVNVAGWHHIIECMETCIKSYSHTYKIILCFQSWYNNFISQDVFVNLCTVDSSLYFMCLMDDFKFLADLIQHIPLPLRSRYVLCCSPINKKMPFVCAMFLKVRPFSILPCLSIYSLWCLASPNDKTITITDTVLYIVFSSHVSCPRMRLPPWTGCVTRWSGHSPPLALCWIWCILKKCMMSLTSICGWGEHQST